MMVLWSAGGGVSWVGGEGHAELFRRQLDVGLECMPSIVVSWVWRFFGQWGKSVADGGDMGEAVQEGGDDGGVVGWRQGDAA